MLKRALKLREFFDDFITQTAILKNRSDDTSQMIDLIGL
ncbi:hypothetical protein D9613_012515 [Agrocybe pediades]|uniref:Uncharacterized protein n=1 Tax=Agrocybe pediades TaxID=84607 RepID=A0A8H4QSP9_9AGAR|nr:hypothetical protein D9613_012515 [Agrocybe pediades]